MGLPSTFHSHNIYITSPHPFWVIMEKLVVGLLTLERVVNSFTWNQETCCIRGVKTIPMKQKTSEELNSH
jgi:hypothetical protein